MFKRWIVSIIGIVLLSSTAILAEFGRIEGKVIDKATGKPLPLANVLIKGTHLGAATDMDGKYFVYNLKPGDYQVMATMMGYAAVTKKVTVAIGQTVHLDFELRESAIEMGGMVVTGTRTPRYIKDVPVRTEVITARRLKERAVPNLYEALEGVPGIRVEQQCSYCNFSVIRMQGLESGHCQILIDGQPTYSGLASVYGAQQVPAENMDRIEIVKGAGSALYGSSALSGIINIVTKKPGAEPSVKAKTSFGTHNTNEYSLSAGRRYGNMDMIVNAQKNTGAGIEEDNDGFTDRVKTDNLVLGARLNAYNILGDDQITFSGQTLNESRIGGEIGDADSEDDWLPGCWENPFSGGTENIKTTRYEVGMGYKKKFVYGNEITLNLSYCNHDRNATNDGFLGDYMDTHGDTVPPVNEMVPYLAKENLYVVDWNYFHPIGGSHRLLGGVQYSYNKLDESGRYVIVDEEDTLNYGGTYTSESEKYAHEVGVYLQDEFSIISGILELVLGARYDIHRSKDSFGGSGKVAPQELIEIEYDEEAISPRLALMYRLSPEFALRISAGTGFRVPYGFSEDLHLCSGSPRVYKGADLKPEKSVSVNFGADYSSRRFTVNANVFRTALKDKIGFTDAESGSKEADLGYTYKWENIGNAYTQGVELSSRVLISNDFALDLTMAYTDAQYEHKRDDWKDSPYYDNSKYIPRVPWLTGNIGIGFTPSNWNLTVSGDYTGRMYIDYCEEEEFWQGDNPDEAGYNSKIKHTDPFWVMSGRIARSFPDQGITFFAGVKNLLDYVQDEKHPDDAAFMYAPYSGRIIYGGVEVKL